ncbi:hypothetical protein [Lyngbya confervoides]|uniref:Transposase n=1 Tax=Lyngbya confervoides BDU141951 TaxID=1574623 RepID=A0ABD4SZT1_9CYAN|nr:hypothetical protein [Lyngbya confervoides]MCM1981873.1 hypothetical protein [Lyngbya confervoides BDU141951]
MEVSGFIGRKWVVEIRLAGAHDDLRKGKDPMDGAAANQRTAPDPW